jgi:shikimate kinase
VIGKILASKINRKFIDLDKKIEIKFNNEYKKFFSCRQIMQEYGEPFFRDIEEKTLTYVVKSKPAIIALGGGTPVKKENQLIIKPHVIVHINASKKIVFERIMSKGKPAFFTLDKEPIEFFNDLWNKREPIYKKLATFSINNNQLMTKTVKNIIKKLKICDRKSCGDKK